jgi:predicted flap endonuclease-1-like 5' DNA nuclease
MNELQNYWPLIAVAVVVIVILAFVLLRPRQRVRLSDSAPVRPHMAQARPAEGRGIAGEAAAATSDVAGEIIRAPVHRQLDGGGEEHDDLCRLKGVGPRFADALQAAGFHRYEQLAGLSASEVERLDAQLGAFRGRLTRDRVVEQADYLARNDVDGYEQKFGKL